ncbi:hypothetical protein ACO9S2_04535 [Nitrospira sp. NS4]|uniref:hypothetical protein n=1 Tax=Nitrospira sp. NS4 TaxID=3414498 RepID=UPI003C2B3585
MERWMDIQKLGQLLRWMGSLLLLGASASFMLEGWQNFGSQLRYYLFLGYLLSLAGLGILLSSRVKEDKSARTLLALAVAGIAAQYSQLGAMIHSMVSADNGALPGSLLYDAAGWGQIALNGAATVLLLGPIALIGFSALNRPQARLLTGVYLLACSSLLIPVRHGLPATLVLIAVATLTLWIDSRFVTGTTVGGTGEGIIGRLLLLLPSGILAARTAFYPQSDLFIGMTSLLVGALFFEMLPRFVKEDTEKSRIQALSTAPMTLGWSVIAFQYFPTVFSTQGAPLMTLLPFSALLTALSLRSSGGGAYYRKVASMLALISLLAQMGTQAILLSSFLCVALSTFMIFAGFRYQERAVFSAGIVGLIFGIGYHLRFAVQLYAQSPWALLAAAGILVLLSASYLEKHATRMFGRLVLLKEEMKAWR